MKVLIKTSPLESLHQYRGVGAYTKNLIAALKARKDKNEYFFSRGENVPKNIDLAHYPWFDLFQLTLPVEKPYPTVVTVHDVIPLLFPEHYPKGAKGWLKFRVQKFSLKEARAVITDSENSKADIIKHLFLPGEKIFVVPLAPSSTFRKLKQGDWSKKTRKKYKLPKKFALYVGDVNWNKNVVGLVEAAKKAKIPVVIVGKQAAEKDFDRTHPENQPLVELHQLVDSEIILTGFVPDKDLVKIYNLASVYVQPSFYEGFGLPALEAMACGVPVVSSNRASLPEVLGKAAIFVNPDDYNKIAAGIKKALALSPTEREKVIKKGQTQAAKYSWKKVADETVAVYRQAVKGR